MLVAAGSISVGVHPEAHVFGLTIDTDIVTSTLLAAVILLYMGFRIRAKVTDGVPGKLQLMWELLVEQVNDLADSAIGPKGRRFVPIGVTLFLFILICNWIGFIPSALHPGSSAEILPAPTSDVNLPLAMALFVIAWVHVESFRARGFRGYFRHYREPYLALTPINVIEEITKPITLTFRLFGNLFSGGLMVAVMVSLLPIFVSPLAELVWKPFDLFIGLIQAYIFMLLTVLYFAFATSHEEHEPVLEPSH
ncbi:MAG TPA: F0F1 ATP synthase subunit A [Acidimicrobiales bacterium]|nr:F0F1 ATP synthase subunit A [Acidimicrobiales bacterium]